MLAARLYGPRDLRVEEVEQPATPEGWALVRSVSIGICGTDKAFYAGTYPLFKAPLFPGHEVARPPSASLRAALLLRRGLVKPLITSVVEGLWRVGEAFERSFDRREFKVVLRV